MSFRVNRLRDGEWLVGVSGLLLLVCLFALPWYGFTSAYGPTAATLGVKTSYDGWQSLEFVRFLIVLLALGGIVTWWLQATRPAAAIPICAVVLEVALGVIVLIALIDRVLVNLPVDSRLVDAKWGAYAGLMLTLLVLTGAYRSLRRDDVAAEDAPTEIETLRVRLRPEAGVR
jgi:hypothetical protein